jgi:hypothetical protein
MMRSTDDLVRAFQRTILAARAREQILDIDEVNDTWCCFRPRLQQICQALSQGAYRSAADLCRRHSYRRDSALMAQSVQLRDVLHDGLQTSVHTQVVGACHNDDQIGALLV